MQGSTYNQKTWGLIMNAIVSIPNSFSVHTTGRREDVATPIYRDVKDEPVGFKIGYADGFALSSQADVIIHHGGFGTISQWVLSTGERLIQEREVLKTLLMDSNDDEISQFLDTLRGTPRSISVCNTFEQEKNARRLNTLAGENICSVLTTDDVVDSLQGRDMIENIIKSKLTNPVDTHERLFWIQLVEQVSTMNAPTHIALILERMMDSVLQPGT